MNGGEFVSQTGMRHRVKMYGTGFMVGQCGLHLRDSGVVQGRVQDCRRCFPAVPDFSSDTQRELEALTVQRDSARGIAAQLEAENAALTEALRDFAEHGLRADLNPTMMHWNDGTAMYSALCRYIQRIDEIVRARAAAALAPVDGDQ